MKENHFKIHVKNHEEIKLNLNIGLTDINNRQVPPNSPITVGLLTLAQMRGKSISSIQCS